MRADSRAQPDARLRNDLQRTRLPACRVERSARLLVGSKAALDGVEADARALRPLQLRHVCDQRAAQRALAAARQAAQRQQAGRSLLRVHLRQPRRGWGRKTSRCLLRSCAWCGNATKRVVLDEGAVAGGRHRPTARLTHCRTCRTKAVLSASYDTLRATAPHLRPSSCVTSREAACLRLQSAAARAPHSLPWRCAWRRVSCSATAPPALRRPPTAARCRRVRVRCCRAPRAFACEGCARARAAAPAADA